MEPESLWMMYGLFVCSEDAFVSWDRALKAMMRGIASKAKMSFLGSMLPTQINHLCLFKIQKGK